MRSWVQYIAQTTSDILDGWCWANSSRYPTESLAELFCCNFPTEGFQIERERKKEEGKVLIVVLPASFDF